MRTSKRVVAESGKDSKTPTGERTESPLFLQRDGSTNAGVGLTVTSIETVVSNHLEMFFGDVSDQSFDEIHGRNGFVDKTVIFVSVVMEGDGISNFVIGINTGSSNDGAPKISTDVFENSGRAAFAAFGIDIETVFGIAVNSSFETFEFRRKPFLKQIQKDGLEGFTQKNVVEVRNRAPKAKFVDATFRNKTVDMRVPFEITAKCVKDANETRDKMARVINVEKEAGDHLINGRKEQV